MAVINFRLGKTIIDASARVNLHTLSAGLDHPAGGLFPLRLSAWVNDDFRLANGWPVEVPSCDIRVAALISATGEVLADRSDPGDISTAADSRWIADEDFYNITELTWRTFQSNLPLTATTTVDTAPTLVLDYEYKIGLELFYTKAVNFDADSAQCFTLDALSGYSAYSVIMVGSFNSVYGNSLDLPYSGIWCPATRSDGWASVTLQGTALYLETDQTPRTKVMTLAHLVSISQPMMLAMVFDHPFTTFYIGTGPSSIASAKVSSGATPTPITSPILIGSIGEDALHTADMALLDLGVYVNALTADQVHAEFAALSSVYGGDR